jgi:phage protein U
MYAQLGDIIFEGATGFQTFSRSRTGTNVEVGTIDGKPRLQRNGTNLESVQIDIRLHSAFGAGDPIDLITKLNTWQDEGQVLPLIDGQGEVLGNYVLQKVGDSIDIMRIDGKIISATVSIDLLEFYDPSPEVTLKRAAIQNGFATNPLKVIPIRVARVATTPSAMASLEGKSAMANAKGAAGSVQSVVDEPSKLESFFQTAKVKAQAAKADIEKVLQRLNDVESIVTKAPDLLDAAENFRDNADLMITRLEEGDLTNALTQSSALLDSTNTLGASMIPLDVSIILRQS